MPGSISRRHGATRRRLALVFTLIFLAPAVRSARAVCVEFSAPPAISAAAPETFSLVVVDLDGDGDADLATGTLGSDGVVWFENLPPGDGSSWAKHEIPDALVGVTAVAAIDLDGDGATDLLSAAYLDGVVAWHENLPPGDGSGWATATIGTGLDDLRAVAAADLDRDGDPDVLSASRSASGIVWHENLPPGDGSSWAPRTIAADGSDFRAAAIADLDGDGDLDALTGARFGQRWLAWHENLAPGDGSLWTTHTISTAAQGARAVVATDLDGDGDLDVAAASYDGDLIVWYENLAPGDGASWSARTVATGALGAYSVVAVDVDRDGDTDLVSASALDNKVAWHENLAPGDGSSWTIHTLSTSLDFALAVAATDLDGDGDDDVAAAGWESIAWFRNGLAHDEPLFASPAIVATGMVGAFSVVAADLDGDGDLDTLSGSTTVAWHENGDAGWTTHTIATVPLGVYSVFAADVDDDGDLDALAATFDDRIPWYENLPPGDGSSWTEHAVATFADGAFSVFAADLDDDGDLDVVTASFLDDALAWHENLAPGDGSSWARHTISSLADDPRSVFAADVDGDGDPDVLAASSADDEIAWYLNDGSGAGWAQRILSTTASGAISVFAADVDGDGDLDALSASRLDSTVAWYENLVDGDASTWTTHVVSTAPGGAFSVFAADVDGDGDLDALSASVFDGSVDWFRNDGDGASWQSFEIASNAAGARAVVAADLDGDGDLDVASASSYDSKIAWYPNLGTGVFDDGFDSDASTACWSSAAP